MRYSGLVSQALGFLKGVARELRRGVVSIRIMEALAHGPTYGYELMEMLNQSVGGDAGVSPSVVYPTLARLSRHHLVRTYYGRQSLGPVRKYYELTPSGRVTLDELRALLSEVRGSLGPAPVVERGATA